MEPDLKLQRPSLLYKAFVKAWQLGKEALSALAPSNSLLATLRKPFIFFGFIFSTSLVSAYVAQILWTVAFGTVVGSAGFVLGAGIIMGVVGAAIIGFTLWG
jgi:hypothetical protein